MEILWRFLNLLNLWEENDYLPESEKAKLPIFFTRCKEPIPETDRDIPGGILIDPRSEYRIGRSLPSLFNLQPAIFGSAIICSVSFPVTPGEPKGLRKGNVPNNSNILCTAFDQDADPVRIVAGPGMGRPERISRNVGSVLFLLWVWLHRANQRPFRSTRKE